MSRFSLLPPRSGSHWFRVGTVDVTTTTLIAALGSISMVLYAIHPSVLDPFALWPPDVAGGQAWRLVSWPLQNPPDPFVLLNLFVFWYFGSAIEAMLGRRRMLWFVSLLVVITSVGAMAFAAVFPFDYPVGGIGLLAIAVLVAFAAAMPNATFFMGIPAWGFVSAIVAIDALQFIGVRDMPGLIAEAFLVGLALVLARSFVISRVAWIPSVPLPGFIWDDGTAKQRKRTAKAAHLKVVHDDDLDTLLDKIASKGIDSLSADERRRLDEHSGRRRGGE